MRIYIAAPWTEKATAIEVGEKFKEAGHTITSRWFHHQGDASDSTGVTAPNWRIIKQANEDIKDVLAADVLVVLNINKSEGKAVETGIAIANDIPVISVGKRSNIFQTLGTELETVEDVIEFLE